MTAVVCDPDVTIDTTVRVLTMGRVVPPKTPVRLPGGVKKEAPPSEVTVFAEATVTVAGDGSTVAVVATVNAAADVEGVVAGWAVEEDGDGLAAATALMMAVSMPWSARLPEAEVTDLR